MTKRNLRKRLALTVVAALSAAGFGTLSAPVANAAQSSLLNSTYVVGTSLVTDIAVTTDLAPVAAPLGGEVAHTIYWKTQTTVSAGRANPQVLLVSAPATSALAEDESADGTGGSGVAEHVTAAGGTSDAEDAYLALSSVSTAVNGSYYYGTTVLEATYDKAGTYRWTIWDDLNVSGSVDNGEYAETFSVVVAAGDAALTITMAAHNSTSGAGSIYGSLVKITSTDAAGNPAAPSSAGGVTITASGSAQVTMVNGSDVTAPAST